MPSTRQDIYEQRIRIDAKLRRTSTTAAERVSLMEERAGLQEGCARNPQGHMPDAVTRGSYCAVCGAVLARERLAA